MPPQPGSVLPAPNEPVPAPDSQEPQLLGEIYPVGNRIEVPIDANALTGELSPQSTVHAQAEHVPAEDIIQRAQRVPLHQQVKRLLFEAGYKPQHERKKRMGWRERLITAGSLVGVLAVSACTTGQAGAAHPSRPEGPPSPTAAATSTAFFHAKIQDRLSGSPDLGDIRAARAAIAHPPSDLLAPTTDLSVEADNRAAEQAVVDGPTYPDNAGLRQSLNEAGQVHDPYIRAEAISAIRTAYLDGAIQDASQATDENGNYSSTGAKNTLDKDLAPFHDKGLTQGAEKMLQIEQARTLLDNFTPNDPPTAHDMEGFMKAAEKISDPEARHLLVQAAEAQFAGNVLDDLGSGYEGFSVLKARALIEAQITDHKVKDLALAALDSWVNIGLGSGYTADINSQDKLSALSDSSRFDTLEQWREEALTGFHTPANEAPFQVFDDAASKAAGQDDAQLDKALTDFNGEISPVSTKINARLAHPDATINLSHVNASQQIPNVGRFYGADGETYQEPTSYNQFAEIYAHGGKVQFKINVDSNLNDKAIAQMQIVFNNIKPLLEAAFASGDLNSVHFVAVPTSDFNPDFVPESHQIYLKLPKDNNVSMEELQNLIVHETSHSLLRTVFSGDNPPSASDTRMVVNACREVRHTTYETLTSDLKYVYPKLLNNLLEEVKQKSPLDAPVIETLIHLFKTDNVAELFAPGGTENTVQNECMQTSMGDLMTLAMEQTAKYPDKYKADTDSYINHVNSTLVNLPAFQALHDHWNQSTDSYSIYTTFNESEYLQNYSQDPDMATELGHTQDNAEELFASLVDDAVNYPDALGKAIGELPGGAEFGNQRDAALIALRTALNLVVERHHTTTRFFDHRMQQIVHAAGVPKHNARYWLKDTVDIHQPAA